MKSTWLARFTFAAIVPLSSSFGCSSQPAGSAPGGGAMNLGGHESNGFGCHLEHRLLRLERRFWLPIALAALAAPGRARLPFLELNEGKQMQHRYRNHAITSSSIILGLLLAAPARAASLQQVNDWGASGVPSYVKMYIYVPDKLATKPPILVSAHSCGSTATGQMGNIPKIKAAADANGFILILPDNPGQNCWDVGAKDTSLKHDAGGDTKAVSQMVKYALSKYNGDAARVYAMGGSSGAMLTQALMAVYPDIFRAGSARAGVPAGCWAEGYATSNQWSDSCAGGNVSKTAQQWGDLARGMYAGYTGHRPRLQIMQGDADTTISFKNSAEAIKQWTNVLALSTAPTSTDMLKTSISTYTRQFWKNACGYVVFETWAGKGGTHSMGYEEDDILKFFGLDVAGGADPGTGLSRGRQRWRGRRYGVAGALARAAARARAAVGAARRA